MKIAICGEMGFVKGMIEVKRELEKREHKTKIQEVLGDEKQ